MIAFGVISIIVSVYLYNIAGRYPKYSWADGGGPAFFPQLIIVILIMLSLISIIQNLRERKMLGKKIVDFNLPGLTRNNFFWLGLVFILFALPLLLGKIGFIATALIAIPLTSLIIKTRAGAVTKKDLLIILATTLVFSFGISYFFEKFLRIPLPKGPFIL